MRPRRVGFAHDSQKSRLDAVLAAGSSFPTEMKRMRCHDEDSEDLAPIDWDRSSMFKIEIYAKSTDNKYEAGIFCDNEKHLVLLGDFLKSAMKSVLYGTSSDYTLVYDRTTRLGRYGNLRRYIHYGADGKPVPFEQFKKQVDMEAFANEIKMFAASKTHTISYNKVAEISERGYPPDMLAVTIEGRLTVSERL